MPERKGYSFKAGTRSSVTVLQPTFSSHQAMCVDENAGAYGFARKYRREPVGI